MSAIPEAPLDGTDVDFEMTRPARNRMLFLAAAVALLLVGGTTLLITQPWNPRAYDQRATEEADTSMAGFPGEVSHLSSQDYVENIKYREYALQADKTLVAFRDRLGKWAIASRYLFAHLTNGMGEGGVGDLTSGLTASQELAASLEEGSEQIANMRIEDDELLRERGELMVLSSYLSEEIKILVNAWLVASRAPSISEAMTDAQTVMATPLDGHTLDEWHNLFVNAYVSEHA